jgi:hypothetical protein
MTKRREETLGYGVVQNEKDIQGAAQALGCKKAFSFYYGTTAWMTTRPIEIRARLIFLFRLLQVNTVFAMDPYDHYDENPITCGWQSRRGGLLDVGRQQGISRAL